MYKHLNYNDLDILLGFEKTKAKLDVYVVSIESIIRKAFPELPMNKMLDMNSKHYAVHFVVGHNIIKIGIDWSLGEAFFGGTIRCSTQTPLSQAAVIEKEWCYWEGEEWMEYINYKRLADFMFVDSHYAEMEELKGFITQICEDIFDLITTIEKTY
tara:strand:- start:1103 stop:1570 length:468 start_codon:yes stop_codon:yes gene_type:complete